MQTELVGPARVSVLGGITRIEGFPVQASGLKRPQRLRFTKVSLRAVWDLLRRTQMACLDAVAPSAAAPVASYLLSL